MKIVDAERQAGDRRGCSRATARGRSRLRARASRRSSTACARGGDRGAGRASRSGSTASTAPIEVDARRRCAPARRRVDAGGAAGDRARRRATSRASRRGRSRSTATSQVVAGVTVEQRVEPLARVGCYVPGGRFPLPSSLLMTAVPARVAGVARDRRGLPAAGAGGDGGGARGRRDAAVPHRRRARDRGARLRHRRPCRASTRSSAPATATSRPPRRWSRADCAIDFYAGPTEIVIVAGARPAGVDRRRPDRAGRARSGRARDLHHLEPRARRRGSRGGRRAQRRPARHRRSSRSRAQRRGHRRRARATRRWRWPTASRRSISSSIARRWRSGR